MDKIKREQLKEQIKRGINCRDLIKKSKHGEYICPECGSGEHKNHTGAVNYYAPTNTCFCFACHTYFDSIKLLELEYGLDYLGALKKGAELLNISENPSFNGRKSSAGNHTTRTDKSPQIENTGRVDRTEYYAKAHKNINDPEAVKYLNSRGLDMYTAEQFNIGYDNHKIIIPCTGSFYIARATDDKKAFYNPTGTAVEPFNLEALRGSEKYIFICESTIDALSIIQAGSQAIATNGTTHAPTLARAIVDFEEANPGATEHIYLIAMDNDEAGAKAGEQIAETLSNNGINYEMANICDGYKDANELLTADPGALISNICNVINDMEAKEAERNGDYITRFVLDIQSEKYKPLKTNMPFIDDLCNGGLLPGSLFLLMAAPATGKTTLCQQMAEGLATAGEPVVYINLEMNRAQLLARSISAKAYAGGLDYSADEILTGYKWTDTARRDILATIEAYKQENSPNIVYSTSEEVGNDLDAIIKYLDENARENIANGKKAPAVIIDYLHFVTVKGAEPQEAIKKIVEKLKRYAITRNTFVVAISAINRQSSGRITLNSGRDSSNLEYTGDYVISLEYTDIDNGAVNPQSAEEVARLQRANPREMTIRTLKARMGSAGKSHAILYNPRNNVFYLDEALKPDTSGITFEGKPMRL